MRILFVALLVAAPAAAQQRPQTAIVPDTITVGDVFHAAVRVELPRGARLAAPDSLVLGADLEAAGRRELRVDTATSLATVVYPLTAWRPGAYELGDVTVEVVGDGGTSSYTVTLPSFVVQSVLPPDTAGIEAKPARDVLGANRVWWPILLALLLALLAALAFYVWWRRRRGDVEEVEIAPSTPPYELARAQLALLSREGLLERGEFRQFYERMTAILRRYAAAVDGRWSTDLTTSELAARLRADLDPVVAVELIRVLGAADLVKFARATTTRDSAAHDLDAARAWVDRTAPAPPADPERRAA